jgi:hypothetical protein
VAVCELTFPNSEVRGEAVFSTREVVKGVVVIALLRVGNCALGGRPYESYLSAPDEERFALFVVTGVVE